MKTQHTHGPWIGGFAVQGANGEPVCRVLSTAPWSNKTDALKFGCGGFKLKTSNETATSNARLISAAPDLLAALSRLVEWADSGCDPSQKSFESARAALKKATGHL